MSAENLKLKTVRSEVHYRGNYSENAFGLLASPTALYRSLLKHLNVFGATLQNFKVETPSLAETHLSCVLLDISTAIRVRLDRFELDFWKFHELGTETTNRIAVSTWTAIRDADDSLHLTAHAVDLNILAEVEGGTSADLISRYVRTPEVLGAMDLGVAFYTPPVQSNAEPWINIVIDRVFRQDKQVLIKLTVGFDANAVPLETFALEVDRYTTTILDRLGLYFATGEQA